MERKTPQKILLWNDCHVSYIWLKERIFYSSQVKLKIKTKNSQRPPETTVFVSGCHLKTIYENYLNWFRDSKSRTCSRLHLLQNKKSKKVLFLV